MVNHRASTPMECRSRSSTGSPAIIEFGGLRTHCGSCGVRGLCMTMGLPPEAMRQLDEIISHRKAVRKRDTLFRPGDAFTALYAIRLGTFKTVVLAEDGREQITGCHLPGDLIGLDGIGDEHHACDAIALEDSEVCVLPFNRLDRLAHELPVLQANLYRFLSKDIRRDQDMMMLLGSRSAEERLALFLLNLAERYRARGYSSSEFVLRMTRDEIASYLGLKLETVSRLFTRLQEEGFLQVEGRAIKVLDASGLRHLIGH